MEALFLVVGGLIVPPKENAVCTAAILDFFVMSSTPEVVKTHLSSSDVKFPKKLFFMETSGKIHI